MSSGPLRLGLCAGEPSGDILAGAILRSWRAQAPALEVSGIGGEQAIRAGLESCAPMERLSVMGLVEPLKRLPELLSIRRELIARQITRRPNLFIGVDSPDFNLPVERRLKAAGIPTAHLVSPSIWAWRQGRIRGIRKAVDKMLCLLPFEVDLYHQAGIDAVCVGHPLADELAMLPPAAQCKETFGLSEHGTVLGVLPGSRESEVRYLMPIFIEALEILHRHAPDLQFLVPAANQDRHAQILEMLQGQDVPVKVVLGHGREAMHCSDALLIASGTATLEAMFLKKPMVISYRMAAASWMLLSRMVKTPFVGLPNILAREAVAPEILQQDVTAPRLADEVMRVLDQGGVAQVARFNDLAGQIGGDFARRSVEALSPLAER